MTLTRVVILEKETDLYTRQKRIQTANFVFCPAGDGTLKVLKDRSGMLGHNIKMDDYPELFL